MQKLILLFTVVIFGSCSGEAPIDASEEVTGTVSIADLDLAEKSELAQLMRVMEAHADAVAVSFKDDASLPPPPMDIDKLSTATPTADMHIDQNSFPIFVEEYQEKIATLYEAPENERQSAYNMVIQTCANCHYSHCPGPLMKIEKMYVE